MYLLNEELFKETNSFLDISKCRRLVGRFCGMVENLFFAKLIPMTSSEKVGALDKDLSEQSAKSFPSNFQHVHTLLSGHFRCVLQ